VGQSDLPLASGRKHVKVFESLGWVVRRDASHIVMTRLGSEATLSILHMTRWRERHYIAL
jgi:hypothetical protein